MKYRVLYFEDEFSCVDEIVIDADSKNELKQKADDYWASMPNKENIAGSKWYLIDKSQKSHWL